MGLQSLLTTAGFLKSTFQVQGPEIQNVSNKTHNKLKVSFALEAVKSEKCSVFSPLFSTLIYPRDPGHSATLSVTGGRGQITTASAFYCRSPTASGPIIVQPVVRNDSVARIQNTYI